MSELAVRHTLTGIVSTIPEEHLDFFKDADGNRVFVEVTEDELKQMRRDAEVAMYGHALDEAPEDEAPTQSWTKARIAEYAEAHNIELDSTATKAEQLDTIATAEVAN